MCERLTIKNQIQIKTFNSKEAVWIKRTTPNHSQIVTKATDLRHWMRFGSVESVLYNIVIRSYLLSFSWSDEQVVHSVYNTVQYLYTYTLCDRCLRTRPILFTCIHKHQKVFQTRAHRMWRHVHFHTYMPLNINKSTRVVLILVLLADFSRLSQELSVHWNEQWVHCSVMSVGRWKSPMQLCCSIIFFHTKFTRPFCYEAALIPVPILHCSVLYYHWRLAGEKECSVA